MMHHPHTRSQKQTKIPNTVIGMKAVFKTQKKRLFLKMERITFRIPLFSVMCKRGKKKVHPRPRGTTITNTSTHSIQCFQICCSGSLG